MITLYRCSPPKKKTLWKCGGSCQTPQHLVDQSWCLCVCCCTLSCFYSRTGSSFTPHALTLSSRLLGPRNLIRAPVLVICAIRYCKKKKKRERERKRERKSCHMVFTAADRRKCHLVLWPGQLLRRFKSCGWKLKFIVCVRKKKKKWKKKKFGVDVWAACWIYFPWFLTACWWWLCKKMWPRCRETFLRYRLLLFSSWSWGGILK